jgi:peroxiredoxin
MTGEPQDSKATGRARSSKPATGDDMRIRHGIAAAIVSVLLAGLVVVLTTPEAGSAPAAPLGPLDELEPQLVTRRPAPDFELPDRQGRMHSLRALRGRPVVLNFWSVDCPPCVEEMPSLQRLSEIAQAHENFAVVTVSVDPSWDAVSRLFPEGDQTLVLFDPQRHVVTERYGTSMFPETYLIDADGNIRARFDGARDWSSRAVIEALQSL